MIEPVAPAFLAAAPPPIDIESPPEVPRFDTPSPPPPKPDPYGRLERIREPSLAIQVCDLVNLHTALGISKTSPLLEFGYLVAESGDRPQAEETLAKLLFAVSYRRKSVTKLVDINDLDGTTKRLDALLLDLGGPLTERQLSLCLVTPNGDVNFGLIPYYVSRSNTTHPNLEQLYRSCRLRRIIESIKGPYPARSQRLIRETLNIPPHIPVLAEHGPAAVICALLTPHRQQDIGSCFSTSICIQLQTARPDRCAQDWADLLQKGYLERSIDGKALRFPLTESLKPCPDDLPLLAAWDRCVGSMAESGKDGVITQRLIHCLQSGLLSHTAEVLQGCDDVVKRLHTAVIDTVIERRRYFYIDGAFVLADHSRNDEIVRNAPQFLDFIRGCLEAVPEEDDAFFMSGLTHLRASLDETLLRHYPDDETRQHAPWLDLGSNSPRPVLQTYLELDELPEKIHLQPKRTEQLLRYLIDLIRDAPDRLQERFRSSPHLLVPVSTQGHHAFSLKFGSPTFVRAWTARYPEYSHAWIQQNLTDPGRVIARQAVPAETRAAILAHFEIPDTFPRVVDLADFRDRLIEVLGIKPCDLDSCLLQVLPSELRQEITARAIRFADSNWHLNGLPIDFAFIFNPFSDRLEIWDVDSHGRFRALDQDHWILKREWVFYPDCLTLMSK